MTELAPDRFQRLAKAGFLSELVPVVPIDATLSPHSRLGERRRGKIPGRYNSIEKNWRGFVDWTQHVADWNHIQQWQRWPNVGVGLQCRQIVGLDFDVGNQDLADACLAWCHNNIGPAPYRIGQSPRLLVPYRVTEPVTVSHVNFIGGALDVLGAGTMFVANGIHHRTLAPYQWPLGDLADVGMAGLTVATREQIEATKAWFTETMHQRGYNTVHAPSVRPVVCVVPDDFEIDRPEYVSRARAWLLYRARPAIEGQGGDRLTMNTAQILGDWGLSAETAYQVMSEHWNPRCSPPWDEQELWAKVGNAFQYRRQPIGCHARPIQQRETREVQHDHEANPAC